MKSCFLVIDFASFRSDASFLSSLIYFSLRILQFILQRAKRNKSAELTVITGFGHNSQGGRGKLKPAVQAYLQKFNYSYSTPMDGEFKVYLK